MLFFSLFCSWMLSFSLLFVNVVITRASSPVPGQVGEGRGVVLWLESWRIWSLCPSICCWRCTSQGPVAWGSDEPGEMKSKPVHFLLLLKESYSTIETVLFVCLCVWVGFFLPNTSRSHIFTHFTERQNNWPHRGKPFLKMANSFWKWKNKPVQEEGKKYIYIINFSSAPLFLYFILLKRRALFCGVTLKSRTHTHKTKKHFPFVLTRGCAVIIYRFW